MSALAIAFARQLIRLAGPLVLSPAAISVTGWDRKHPRATTPTRIYSMKKLSRPSAVAQPVASRTSITNCAARLANVGLDRCWWRSVSRRDLSLPAKSSVTKPRSASAIWSRSWCQPVQNPDLTRWPAGRMPNHLSAPSSPLLLASQSRPSSQPAQSSRHPTTFPIFSRRGLLVSSRLRRTAISAAALVQSSRSRTDSPKNSSAMRSSQPRVIRVFHPCARTSCPT